jgi:hypothetical protein
VVVVGGSRIGLIVQLVSEVLVVVVVVVQAETEVLVVAQAGREQLAEMVGVAEAPVLEVLAL